MDHQEPSTSSGYSGKARKRDEEKDRNQRKSDGDHRGTDNHTRRYNESDPGIQGQRNHTKNAGSQTSNERRHSSRQSPDDFLSSSDSCDTSRIYFGFIKPPKKIVDFEGCRITVGVVFTTNVPLQFLQADWYFHRARITRQRNFKISSDGYRVRHVISIILDQSMSGSSRCRIRIIDSQKNIRGCYVVRSRCIVLERQVIPGICRPGRARSAIDVRPNGVPKQNIGSQNPVNRDINRTGPPPPPQSSQSANGYNRDLVSEPRNKNNNNNNNRPGLPPPETSSQSSSNGFNRGSKNGLSSFLARYKRNGTTNGNILSRAGTSSGSSSSGPVIEKCRPQQCGSSPYQPHEEGQSENEQALLREVTILLEDINLTPSQNDNSSSNSSGWRRFVDRRTKTRKSHHSRLRTAPYTPPRFRSLTRLYYTIEGLMYWVVCRGHVLYYSTLCLWYLIVREYNKISEGIRQMNRENR